MEPLTSDDGFTLVETVVVVAIAGILIGALASFALGGRPYALRAGATALGDAFEEGRQLARVSGDGATLVITLNGAGSTARIYAGRPRPAATFEASPAHRLEMPVIVGIEGLASAPPVAFFISSSGTVSAAAWSVGAPALGAEPVCSGELVIVLGNGMRSETHSVSCADARLR